MWSKISSKCQYPISSAFEVGCNTGANLHVLKNIFPEIQLEAVEINKKAADMAGNIGFTVYNTSISEFNSGKLFDIVFTSGVLIHIHPDELDAVYDKIYSLSKKYILICEYYNPVPVEIVYRGEKGKLFKRDFAGELLDRFPDLRLVDYAFSYHRDPVFPQDDSTYFLLEKK